MSEFDSSKIEYIIGIMSGTSLDGLDIAACSFARDTEVWKYTVAAAETVVYDAKWRHRLAGAQNLSSFELIQLHNEFGSYVGKSVADFCKRNKINPSKSWISSHGHTVFHRPEQGVTLQIGSGIHIADAACMPVVYDFRTADVALHGQGAPLVPVGDKFLFSTYNAFLNIGGFANCSYFSEDRLIAFDICPANIVLNYFSSQAGKSYDKNGNIGRNGKLNRIVLERLNSLPYYSLNPPKSLGREWVEQNIFPFFEDAGLSPEDCLRTYYEHIAVQIKSVLNEYSNILVTGGGAHNSFLMELMNDDVVKPFVIPNKQCVDFKEAIVFAFLGYLKLLGQPNVLSSVTGADYDHSSGIVVYPSNSKQFTVNK
ncbi:MAG: anhydro-N-acetylmuramic acid kinase [Bacteroidales bacterium]|nr:anhydro-N-acetylmuramic acid kinase [Bacteroidales bacterium]HOY39155.1 anhydro-N-acetylmuramic acid kinase [Bacteroidales bacterium]HQP05034.1 anhydro-N-acetylmuramic acid kinase [Bacteroidales bacterium]